MLTFLIWTISVIIGIVLFHRYSQKVLVETYRDLWTREANSRTRLMIAYTKQAQELTKLRAFYHRFTALIESTKKKRR